MKRACLITGSAGIIFNAFRSASDTWRRKSYLTLITLTIGFMSAHRTVDSGASLRSCKLITIDSLAWAGPFNVVFGLVGTSCASIAGGLLHQRSICRCTFRLIERAVTLAINSSRTNKATDAEFPKRTLDPFHFFS